MAATETTETTPTNIDESGFLSRRDVARLFGVSTSTVTRWAQKGLLRTVRTPGGHSRFPTGETRRAAARAGLAGLVRLD